MIDSSSAPRGIAEAAEGEAFLATHPDVEAVQLVITDANGIGRGKNIAREELATLYTHGRNVAGSILGLDITGEDVEGTGLVWEVGDADQCCRPVAGSLRLVPWLTRPTAQVLGTMFGLDGRPAKADPRHVLARVIARCEAAGFTPVVAVELEFYLLERDADGGLVPSRGMLSGQRRTRIDAYGLGRLDDMSPLFDDLYRAARGQGLPVRTLMSEYAPGQFEITLEHRSDALRAVDEAILFKRAVRGVAARHGRVACFMAKPFTARAGSGMHLHASLADRAGTNACAADEPAGSALLRQAIGGLRRTLADGMAIYAPNANSYRRFRALSYAPVAGTWGINNRSVSLRVPAGPPASRHVEHRVAGADANPYLVSALVLGGMLHGIEHRIDPGPPVEGNGYALAVTDELPTQWPAALERAASSSFMRETLGSDFLKVFLAIKQQECEKFGALVTDRDYEWYLDTA
ncbi:MAG TPA: glutamine synthetase family protein [Steroidobacteraceae bacterium]|nr:glutamine synthetase family protein [Steroidobacteraceae bacterium]